jgi:phosphatidylcholine synthase
MYTCLPLLLIWRSGLLPGALAWILLLPLLASAYGFCQLAAKTADGYFLGFPSYWNVVAFYLYVLQPSPEISAVLIVILSLLTFLPTRYLYPSQAGWLNRLACILGLLWAGLVAWVIWRLPTGDAPPGFHSDPDLMWPALLSISFPVYYLLVSWLISWRYYREGRQSYSPGV